MSPLVREWAKGFLDFDEKALEIARQHWTSDRLRVVMGRNKKYQVDAFTAADLQGAVNMDIDYEAMFPKSNATERAEIAQLIQMMILNPGDPQQKLQILKKYGATELLGSIDIDIEEAQKEQADFLVHGKPPQLVPLVQNSFVHFSEHCDFAKTDEFKELPPEQQEVWLAHIQATCVDMGARRALFAEMGLNPDAPEAAEMGSGAAQSALQGGQSVLGPNFDQGQGVVAGPQPGQTLPGTQPGAQVGAAGPSKPSPRKGTTGNGPNQAKAQEARNPVARPIPDIGMIHPPQ